MGETLESWPQPVNGVLKSLPSRFAPSGRKPLHISATMDLGQRRSKRSSLKNRRVCKLAQPLQSRTSKNHYDLTLNVERQVSRESGTRTKASSLGNRWDAFFVIENFRAGRAADADWHGERA